MLRQRRWWNRPSTVLRRAATTRGTESRRTVHGAGILAQHDIAHTVEGALDSPMSAD
jgi:hypothetical protein